MAVTVLDGIDAVRAAAGTHLGHSAWRAVTADDVAGFLRSTSPDGATVATTPVDGLIPALLVVSLSNLFLPEIVEVRGVAAGVNYGTGRIRFPAPAPIGARLRAGADLIDVTDVSGGVQTTIVVTVECEGAAAPACTIESLSRWLAPAGPSRVVTSS